MKIKGPLLKAIFVSRPNRFITVIKIENKLYDSHIADPGRLNELLVPGATLFVRPSKDNLNRKTKFSTIMVDYNGQLVSLVSTLPNIFVKDSIKKKQLPMFNSYKILFSEYSIKKHRIDFVLSNKSNEKLFLEIKSATFVENGVAKFPDAITERGRKHILLLTELVKRGKNAGVLFVCQRSDANSFKPMWDRDPKFGKALLDGFKFGLKIWCISVDISLSEMNFKKEIPFSLIQD